MRVVRKGLHLVHTLTISNVWLLMDHSGTWLVDTGHRLERALLLRALRGVDRLAGILLTHRHSDHAGNAAFLRDRFRCPVVCHAADAPYLTGTATPPRLARGRASFPSEVLCRIEDRWPARSPVDEVVEAGRWRGDWEVVHAPGHTEGSSLLFHGPTGTLFSGDAILAGPPPLRAIERLRLAIPAFTPDPDTCHAQVRAWIATLPPVEALCAGHGPPVTRDVLAKMRRLGGA